MNLFSKYPFKYILLSSVALNIILPKTNTQIAIVYLISLIFFDLLTGIMASYTENTDKTNANKYYSKNKTINNILYIFNFGVLYSIRNVNHKITQVITSKKLKITGVKILLYFSTIIVTYIFEEIFFIKSFNISFSELEFSLTMAIVLFWSLIEWYSIFFENFKRMGIDIKKVLFGLIKNILQIRSEIQKLK